MTAASSGTAATADAPRRRRRGGGGRDGERPMVPDVSFTSYYGRPVVKPSPWQSDIPAYLFLGGMAAGSSLLAAGADIKDLPELRRVARLGALLSVTAGAVALIHDLGKPERFVNMLRVAKPTSPMSVGTWILTAYGPMAGLAGTAEIAGMLPRPIPVVGRLLDLAARPAGLLAAALAPALASYTGVLLSDTATPAWHEARRELPLRVRGLGRRSCRGARDARHQRRAGRACTPDGRGGSGGRPCSRGPHDAEHGAERCNDSLRKSETAHGREPRPHRGRRRGHARPRPSPGSGATCGCRARRRIRLRSFRDLRGRAGIRSRSPIHGHPATEAQRGELVARGWSALSPDRSDGPHPASLPVHPFGRPDAVKVLEEWYGDAAGRPQRLARLGQREWLRQSAEARGREHRR